MFLIVFSTFLLKEIAYQKTEVTRMTNNFNNADFKIDSLKTKNGQTQYIVDALVLTKKELTESNSELIEKVKNLNVKLKNIESVIGVENHYFFSTDTLLIEKKTDSTFKGSYSNEWVTLSQIVSLVNNKTNIKIDSVEIQIFDKILLANEIKYKRVWIFWKKPVAIVTHITSENPYFHLDRMQTYSLIK